MGRISELFKELEEEEERRINELLERQAKRNYEKLSKELRELYTLDDFIEQVKIEYYYQELIKEARINEINNILKYAFDETFKKESKDK